MTVREVLERLQTMPPNMEVCIVYDSETAYDGTIRVDLTENSVDIVAGIEYKEMERMESEATTSSDNVVIPKLVKESFRLWGLKRWLNQERRK